MTPTFRLTGSTINALEYFLITYHYNKNINLMLINGTSTFKKNLIKLANERYNLDNLDGYENNIINIRKSKLVSYKFNVILVLDYMTIKETKGLIIADKIIVISEKYTAHPEYFYNKSLYNVKYYGEMPFHYKDFDYKMKCLFSRYKPLKNVKEGTYINVPGKGILDLKKLQSMNLPRPYLYKSKTNPKENLFEQFTHYLYHHMNEWFDPHPRLFLECTFYEKKIYYLNPFNIQDGSWYRWKDININGIENRTLNKEDEIICQLI
jgi:hypothetical protein